jgi:transcription elongation factor Elf1
MPPIQDCPKCGAELSLETMLRIDLDDVVLGEPDERGVRKVISFAPAHSANDPDTGIVVEEANVTCRECGANIDDSLKSGWAEVPFAIMERWSYREA